MDEKTSEEIAEFSNWMATHNVTVQARGFYEARPDSMYGVACEFCYRNFTFRQFDDQGDSEIINLSLNERWLNGQDDEGLNAHDFLAIALQCAKEAGWDAFARFDKQAVAGMKALHGEENVAA